MKKVKVTVANNEILHLERRMWVDWWLRDTNKFMSFVQNGKRIRLAVHWILKIEPDD